MRKKLGACFKHARLILCMKRIRSFVKKIVSIYSFCRFMGRFQVAGLLDNWGSVAIFCGAKPWPQGVECLVCHGAAKPTSAFRLGYSQAWQWGLNPHVNLCNRRSRSF